MEFQGKRVLILGLAREGVSLARYLEPGRVPRSWSPTAPPERSRRSNSRDLDELHGSVVLGGDHPELVAEAEHLLRQSWCARRTIRSISPRSAHAGSRWKA